MLAHGGQTLTVVIAGEPQGIAQGIAHLRIQRIALIGAAERKHEYVASQSQLDGVGLS